jgi:hypothetical protein
VHVHATKLGAAMQRRENLTWIEQPLVVERAFKSLLLIEVGLGEHRRHQVALLDADAMLASEHAADFDAELEDIGTEGTLAEREELGSNILHLDEPLQRPRLIANIELDDALILLIARILPDRIFGNDSVQPSKMTVKTSPT